MTTKHSRRFLADFASGNWEEGLAWHEGQHRWLDTVEMLPVEWLWEGFIPRGMVTVLTGEEGLGKSQLALKIAAEFTRGVFGDKHPDGSGRPGGLVKFYTAEDSLKHTLVPRLVANNAVMTNVAAEGIRSRFTLTEQGISEMARGVQEVGFGMIVIDPIIAYFGARSDSNKAQDVREVMRRLAALAEETDCVIIGIAHPKKGEEAQALHKMIGGSSAFGQAARSVLAVARHPEEENQRVVGRIKGNLDRPPRPVAYEIVGTLLEKRGARGEDIKTSKIETRGIMPAEFDLEAALLRRSQPGEQPRGEKQAAAVDFLRSQLSDGRVKASDLRKLSAGQPFSYGTMDSAASLLGVLRPVIDGATYWELPPEED